MYIFQPNPLETRLRAFGHFEIFNFLGRPDFKIWLWEDLSPIWRCSENERFWDQCPWIPEKGNWVWFEAIEAGLRNLIVFKHRIIHRAFEWNFSILRISVFFSYKYMGKYHTQKRLKKTQQGSCSRLLTLIQLKNWKSQILKNQRYIHTQGGLNPWTSNPFHSKRLNP